MGKATEDFFWRRLHSLSGLFLVLFLIEHLLTNSEAALFIGEDGHGFVKMVNLIHSLPYLPFIELFLLGFPIILHAAWGLKYLQGAQINSFPGNGSSPSLGGYLRNQAFTWQRVTSWILLFGIAFHVFEMRFEHYPVEAKTMDHKNYMVHQNMDKGLYTLSKRLHVELYDGVHIANMRNGFEEKWTRHNKIIEKEQRKQEGRSLVQSPKKVMFDPERDLLLEKIQNYQIKDNWIKAMESIEVREGEVVAVAPNFGTATLLVVRDTFKSPLMVALYTIFVLAAVFHAFNGLWTFLISWGIVMNPRAQRKARVLTMTLMVLIAFLGLTSVWGTYWINLRY